MTALSEPVRNTEYENVQFPEFDSADQAIWALCIVAVVLIIWGKDSDTILAAIIGAIAGIARTGRGDK